MPKAGVAQSLERAFDPGHAGEEIDGLLHGHLEDLRNILSTKLNIQRFAIKPASAANFTFHKRGRKEVHFQLDGAGAFAFRTAALGAIKRESARSIAAQTRFGDLSEQLA